MTSLGKRTIWAWVWLALIVQIVAPVLAGTSMVAAATDPLAGAWICGHAAGVADPDRPLDPSADACRLCDVVCKGGGLVPPVEAATLPAPVFVVLAVTWGVVRTDLVAPNAPAETRARAPPIAA